MFSVWKDCAKICVFAVQSNRRFSTLSTYKDATKTLTETFTTKNEHIIDTLFHGTFHKITSVISQISPFSPEPITTTTLNIRRHI